MRRTFGFGIAVVLLGLAFAWAHPAKTRPDNDDSYTVTGDVTAGWGTEGGDLWHEILKETDTSTAGGYDGTYTKGVLARPPTSEDLPNPLNPTNHNWTEVDYLFAVGRHGDRALFSVGELDPRFGNQPVRFAANRFGRGFGLEGAGRSVRDVGHINVVHAFTNIKNVPKDVHPYAPMLVVSGAGINPRTFGPADLQAMPQVTFDASSSPSNTVGVWSGPTLLNVLRASGVNTEEMDSYIVVQATDGYATVVSMYEATQLVGNQYSLLAIRDGLNNTINNGTCSDPESANTTCKDGGFVRLVLPKDLAAGRWVSNTAQIIVFSVNEQRWR